MQTVRSRIFRAEGRLESVLRRNVRQQKVQSHLHPLHDIQHLCVRRVCRVLEEYPNKEKRCKHILCVYDDDGDDTKNMNSNASEN